MTKRNRNFWIEVAVLAAVVVAVTSAIVASEMQQLNRNDIKMDVSDIRSFAAVMRELIEEHSTGRLTDQFFETQVEMIADKISTTRQALQTSAMPDAESDRASAADLGDQLEANVHELEHEAGNGLSISSELERIRIAAKVLEERLSE